MKSRIDSIGQRVDLNLLVAFDAIHRSRSLTAAGRVLGLSQPAMSHTLARLRAAFGDPLFVRVPGGLRPTPLADDIAPAIADGLAIIRGSLERKAFDPLTSTRVFNLRLGDIAELVHLPLLVREVQSTAPGVRLNALTLPEAELGEALAAGAVDLAAGHYQLGAACREQELCQGDYACIVRAEHPLVRQRLTLSQFRNAGHVLVVPKGASPHAQVVERALTNGRIKAHVAAQVSNFAAAVAIVASTDLVATMPLALAEALQRQAAIRIVPAPVALPKLKVCLYWHERFHRDPGHAWLRGVYAGLFKTLSPAASRAPR